MPNYREVFDPGEKSRITEEILRSVPEWFGVESSLLEYVETVGPLPFWAAFEGEQPVGFFCGKVHYGRTGDVYVCAVRAGWHGRGVGSDLYQLLEDRFRFLGCEQVIVKTLSERVDYAPYARTRDFYRSCGFTELLTLTEMWDEANPCLIMIKRLTPAPAASSP